MKRPSLPPRPRGRSLRSRVWMRRLAFPAALVLLPLAWVGWERCGGAGCPDLDRIASYQPGRASVLVDRNGEPLGDLAPMEYGVVPLDSLPRYVADAFVAVEDRRFFRHGGVDWLRVLGAAWVNVRDRALLQGSSTLSMQLARTLFPERIPRGSRTPARKLLEVRVALALEDRFTKRELLELYLNHIYLGAGTYGVQAASRHWFGKDARDLTLPEAALLAALPRAPAHYDPRRSPDQARERRDLVLALMVEEGMVEPGAARAARERPLGISAEPVRTGGPASLGPWFVQQVRRELEETLGERLYAEPLRVVTTLDAAAQRAAETALEAQLEMVEAGVFGVSRAPRYRPEDTPPADGTPYLQGAVVLMDAVEGDILAWVGGRDFHHSRFDRARLARRPAGSAFKPLVYGAALEAGFALSQPVLDEPYALAREDGGDWEPGNYSGEFQGPMNLREALVRSQNVPVVRLAAAMEGTGVRDFAARAGIPGVVPASPVAALGVTAVSPLEMTTAYAAFAAGGERPEARTVLRVEDGEGRVVHETMPVRRRVTDPAVAFLVADVLREAVERGTGAGVRQAGYAGPAAGKTGTADGATDVWFVGFTPRLVGTVWVGSDGGRPLPVRATGGAVAAPVWGRILGEAVPEGRLPGTTGADGREGWPAPPRGVVELAIDRETGMALAEGCGAGDPGAEREYFLVGHEPASVCPAGGIRGFLDRVGGFFGSILGGGDDRPDIPGDPDPELGLPRIPERGGAPEEGDPVGEGGD